MAAAAPFIIAAVQKKKQSADQPIDTPGQMAAGGTQGGGGALDFASSILGGMKAGQGQAPGAVPLPTFQPSMQAFQPTMPAFGAMAPAPQPSLLETLQSRSQSKYSRGL